MVRILAWTSFKATVNTGAPQGCQSNLTLKVKKPKEVTNFSRVGATHSPYRLVVRLWRVYSFKLLGEHIPYRNTLALRCFYTLIYHVPRQQ